MLSVLVILFVSGCTASKKSSDINTAVQQRYAEITKQLPVSNGRFALTSAGKSQDAELQLHISATQQSTAEENAQFLSGYARQLCSGAKSNVYLHAGGKYLLLLTGINSLPVTQVVDGNTCYAHG